MPSPTLLQEKLVVVPLIKSVDAPGLVTLETVLLYSVMGKLALHTDVLCKDLATGSERLQLDPYLGHERILAYLKTLAGNYQARYVLTGSITPVLETDETRIEEIRLTLRLYDAVENRYAFEEIRLLEDLEAGGDGFRVKNKSFQALVDWGVAGVLRQVLAVEEAERILPNILQNAFCESFDAVRELIRADQPDRPPSERIAAYESAVRLDPGLEVAHYHLGKLYKSFGDYGQSLASFRKALEVSRSPGRIKALYATEAGICCSLMAEFPLAVQWWQRAIGYDPGHLNPYLNIAHQYEGKDHLAEAERYFLKAQQVAPRDPRPHYSLARIYSKRGEWEKALAQYRFQLETDAQDPWCHSNIATCYLQLGRSQKAMEHFEKTANLDPDGDAGHYARLVLTELVTTP